MTKKTKRWYAIRNQKRKERLRKHRLTKPDHDPHSGRDMETDKPGFNIFRWLSRAIPKAPKIDRRERNGKQGDR